MGVITPTDAQRCLKHFKILNEASINFQAALNMATRSMATDLAKDGIIVTCIHPGWVKTDMGGPKAPMDVEKSVSDIWQFIRGINTGHNGGFFQHDGKKLEW